MKNTPSPDLAPGGWNANDLIGTQLGSCVLERPLGVGGMGAVFLARQLRPKRQVAVKLIRPALSTDPSAWRVFMERFRREADATAALDHANIVPIYEFGEDGSMAYLVMPYLADGSLAALLAAQGRLPLRRAISYLDQTAAALDFAHRHGIIHRDVKPSNLLLHPDGRLVLADFGIARLLQQQETPLPAAAGGGGDGSLTMAGAAMGTPEYMAPELIRGEPVTPLADLYSLATVGYAMLAGRTPFGGGDVAAILARQVHEAPPPLRTWAPETPPEVERVLTWALAKSPSERPQSAKEFARALHMAAASGERGGAGAHAVPAMALDGLTRPADPMGSSLGVRARMGRRSGPRHTEALDTSASARFAAVNPASDATLYDAGIATGPRRAAAGGGGAIPVWPSGSHPTFPPGGSRRMGRRMGPLPLLGLAAALVVLLVMVVVVGSAVGSMMNGGNSQQTQAALAAAATHTAQAQPTATSLPTVTPTPIPTNTPVPTDTPIPTNWLKAMPETIQVGCSNSGNHGTPSTVDITLLNQGNDGVKWSAQVQGGGISLSNTRGSLASGAKTTITIQNTSSFLQHQGTIAFVANNAHAGDPAQVTYQTQACAFGG